MVETSMRHHWWNIQTSTSSGSYSRICQITWRGSAPAAIAEVASLVSCSNACCSKSSATNAALHTMNRPARAGTWSRPGQAANRNR